MDLTPYVDTLRHDLAVAAEAGGQEARELAIRLSGPLDSTARLVLLEALTAAADEITRDLAPGSVEVRLRGRDPSFVVALPPSDESFGAPMSAGPADLHPHPTDPDTDTDDGGTSRINLRLPDALKSRIESSAGRQRLSVNAWLVRAAESALEPGTDRQSVQRNAHGGERITGWVR